MSKQFITPVTAGRNSILMTSSNCLSWFLMFGIVLMNYINLCLNTCNSFIYWSIFSWTYFSLNVSNPTAPPIRRWPSVVIFMFVSLKTDWDFFTTFFFTTNHDLLPSGTWPNLGPSQHNVSHQLHERIIAPAAIKSSGYAAVSPPLIEFHRLQ